MYQFKTTIKCIKSGSTMHEARLMMREHRVRHLPVLSEDNQIVAMLSQHDLTDHPKLKEVPVDFFASAPVKYVSEDTSLREVALLMLNEKISSVLLTDKNDFKVVVGIVTTDDLLYALTHLLTGENNKDSSETSYTELDFLNTVGDLMRRLSDIGI